VLGARSGKLSTMEGPMNDGNTEDSNLQCPASGKNVGRIIEIPGSDDWKIECPTCGCWWHGGSTVLENHDRCH
jgi:hypothetical protein